MAQWKPMSTTGRQERLGRVVPDAIAALHEVLERHQVTEDEWYAVLDYLTAVGKADEFVLLSDVTRTSVLIDALSHGGRRVRRDGQRRRGPALPGRPAVARGAGQDLRGLRGGGARARCCSSAARVTSTDGTPLPDAVIDIWQTGPSGGYDIWDERQPDYNFRGRFGVADRARTSSRR